MRSRSWLAVFVLGAEALAVISSAGCQVVAGIRDVVEGTSVDAAGQGQAAVPDTTGVSTSGTGTAPRPDAIGPTDRDASDASALGDADAASDTSAPEASGATPGAGTPPTTANGCPSDGDVMLGYGLPPEPTVPDAAMTPLPPGYGYYCSLTYDNSTWQFDAYVTTSGDPCKDLLYQYPCGTIAHAGIWSTTGWNSYLVRCNEGEWRYVSTGSTSALDGIRNTERTNDFTSCSFAVSPGYLPIFGLPYGAWNGQADPNADVDPSDFVSFNHDMYYAPIDVAQVFHQPEDPPGTLACAVDRTGRQQCHFGDASECADAGEDAGCLVMDPGKARGWTYVWRMPAGKPVLAVAPGVVVASLDRDVSSYACPQASSGSAQAEIYVRHTIGTGIYAESFVTAYRHMGAREVATGDVVAAGQEIGRVGSSGCATEPELEFGVLRLTNLSGARSYAFGTTALGYGVNGIQGAIDPFGWLSPNEMDPWAWLYAGYTGDDYAPGVADPGAFSIDLWAGEQPPSVLP